MSERHIARILETQLESAHNFARDMFIDLTDDEFFWEPVPGCWSVRRNEGQNPPQLRLHGEPQDVVKPNTRPWFCEHGWVWKGPGRAGWIDTGGASPITTIAWLLTHMSSCEITYHQDVFDSGDRRFDDLVPTNATEAIALFEEGAALLCNSLRELDDADLLKPPAKPKPFEMRQSWVGLNQEPLWQLFTAPTAIHVTHHAAEIGRMRDLYMHSGSHGPD